MNIPKPQVRFIASLSNGETAVEGKGNYDYVPGSPMPWQRLVRYAADNKLEITSLALFTPDGRTFMLPSRSNNPKFRAFDGAEKPLDYQVERQLAREQQAVRHEDGRIEKTGEVQIAGHYTVGVAYFADHKVEVWVDEFNNRKSYYISTKI